MYARCVFRSRKHPFTENRLRSLIDAENNYREKSRMSAILSVGGRGGIRTHDTELPYTGFRVRRIRPLCHPSASREKMDCICAYKKKQGRRPRKAFPCSTASLSLAERQYITSPPERSFPCRSCRDAAPQESSRNHRHSDSFPTQPRAYGRQRDRNH